MSNEFFSEDFSTAEAAAVLGESRIRLQKWLSSEGPVKVRLEQQGGREYRLLHGRDLVYLAFLARLQREVKQLYPETKDKLYKAVLQFLETPSEELPVSDWLALRKARLTLAELQDRVRHLKRARDMVVSDPEIRGGEPVIRGTRIPVHLIADMLRQGATAKEILSGYPRLDEEKLELVRVYASAYRKQGRPKHPWHSAS